MNLFKSKNHKSINIPIEVGFVRACARLEMTPVWQERVQAYLEEKLDWEKVREFANHHRVLPLVYHSLYTHFQDSVPEKFLSEMRIAFHANAARNLFLTDELLKVLGWFQAEGIEAIPFKGAALAKDVYGDVVLRQFDDLDVLVREGDVAAVSEILLSLGYIPVVATVRSEAETFLRHEGESGFHSPCGRYQVDVHWQLAPRSFLDVDQAGLWGRSEVVNLNGVEVRTFSTQDLLLLLTIHGMGHLWSRHAWILDFALVIQGFEELDWREAFECATSKKVERFLKVGLFLVEELDELDCPEWAREEIHRDGGARSLAKELFAMPGFHEPKATSLMKLTLINARARQRMVDKVYYFLSQLLTPSLEDWEVVRLSQNGSVLYRVIRPLRLLNTYGIQPLSKKYRAPVVEDSITEKECVRSI